MTCTIGDLDAGKAVAVTWKDPSGGEVSDDDDYDLAPGTVNDDGVQEAHLTIKVSKLADFAEEDSFTYTCSVSSGQYTASAASADLDVVANVVDLG